MNFPDVPNVVMNMGTISTMRTGHHRLADGSLLRVDIERGSWVGSLYTRDMRVKTRVVGSDVEVHAWAGRVQPKQVGVMTSRRNSQSGSTTSDLA